MLLVKLTLQALGWAAHSPLLLLQMQAAAQSAAQSLAPDTSTATAAATSAPASPQRPVSDMQLKAAAAHVSRCLSELQLQADLLPGPSQQPRDAADWLAAAAAAAGAVAAALAGALQARMVLVQLQEVREGASEGCEP